MTGLKTTAVVIGAVAAIIGGMACPRWAQYADVVGSRLGRVHHDQPGHL